jgi:hypothetical protein
MNPAIDMASGVDRRVSEEKNSEAAARTIGRGPRQAALLLRKQRIRVRPQSS